VSSYTLGPVLLLDPEDLQALAELVAAAARRRGLYGPSLSPSERRVRDLTLTTAARWKALASSGSDRGSDLGSEIDNSVSDLGAFRWIDVQDAASRLSITPRAVVAAIAKSALVARRRGRGRGRWEVAEKSVQLYASRHNRSNRSPER
jgi:hypothetical protein